MRLDAGFLARVPDAQAILMPILAGPPPGIGSLPSDHRNVEAHLAEMEALAPNAALANAAGLPALAIPTLTPAGWPTGVQLIGPPQSDRMLLSMAEGIVEVMPSIPYPAPIAGLAA